MTYSNNAANKEPPLLLHSFSTSIMDELEDVNPSEVSFIEWLKLSKYSAVFHVVIRNRDCAMKVLPPSSRHV